MAEGEGEGGATCRKPLLAVVRSTAPKMAAIFHRLGQEGMVAGGRCHVRRHHQHRPGAAPSTAAASSPMRRTERRGWIGWLRVVKRTGRPDPARVQRPCSMASAVGSELHGGVPRRSTRRKPLHSSSAGAWLWRKSRLSRPSSRTVRMRKHRAL